VKNKNVIFTILLLSVFVFIFCNNVQKSPKNVTFTTHTSSVSSKTNTTNSDCFLVELEEEEDDDDNKDDNIFNEKLFLSVIILLSNTDQLNIHHSKFSVISKVNILKKINFHSLYNIFRI
jgi:hypothetical protein